MGKKEKKFCAINEEFQAMINLIPRLEELLSIHREIAEGYHKFRKNGGEAIPGIEKHLSIKEPEKPSSAKKLEKVSKKVTGEPKEAKSPKKTKKGNLKAKPHSVATMDDAGAVT